MTVLNQTLVLTALILGFFLLYNFTMSVFSSSDCQYNVGCYQVPHSLNHTSQIKGRLEAIENITHQSKSLAYHYRSIVRNQSDFHSKSLMAGRSFDRYVMQFKEQQDYRLQDREILYAINEAEKSYLSCKNEVESNAIRIGCLSTWKQYQQCFESVGVVHQQINGLLNKQKEIQKKIRSEIQQPKEPDPQSRPEINAQKIYNQSMLQNQNALKVLKDRLSLAEFKLRSAKEQKEKSEDRVVSKEHSYSECWQNRRIYKHCEEITNQVKNISTGTLKQLKQQIQAKQKLLQEMQEMMLRMGKGETRKMPEHWTQMYQEHVKQLKQMMVDYIQNEQIQRKACGCSQQEERLLALELQKEKSNLLQLTIQIQNVLLEVKEIRQLINQKQIEKEKIIADYQKALKDYQISVPPASQSHLIKLRKELDQNRLQILQTQKYYQQIGENCNAIKQQLSSLLFDLNKVEECISKKDFLIQLRRQTVTYRHPDRSLVKLMQTKRELALALAAFDQL